MRWFKRDMWKAGIAIVGMLLLLVLMAWVPVSAAGTHEEASGFAAPITVRVTPTVDATVTALSKEQLTLQVKQLQYQLQNQNNWLVNNSTALIAAITAVVAALIGFTQWAGTARQARDKDLKAQAEERFKNAVNGLGDDKEGAQIGAAILLRSFLNKDDKSYERYYTQVFDLAVAYLRLPRAAHPPEDPDGPSPLPEQSDTPQPPTTLSHALIVAFKEAFPLARDKLLKEQGAQFRPQSLDATGVQLDKAYLEGTDLKQVWMPQAFLREVNLSKAYLSGAKLSWANLSWAQLSGAQLSGTKLSRADLSGVKLSGADLSGAKLSGARLREADLSGTVLSGAKLSGAKLREADLSGADLSGADLSGADLRESKLEDALSLEGTNLRRVNGPTKEQLEVYKAKGAIIDENFTISSTQSTVSTPPSLQSSDTQAQSVTPTQGSIPTPDTGGSSATSSQQGPES